MKSEEGKTQWHLEIQREPDACFICFDAESERNQKWTQQEREGGGREQMVVALRRASSSSMVVESLHGSQGCITEGQICDTPSTGKTHLEHYPDSLARYDIQIDCGRDNYLFWWFFLGSAAAHIIRSIPPSPPPSLFPHDGRGSSDGLPAEFDEEPTLPTLVFGERER
ncbi:hypothetical protein ASPWEDRAFT_249851 [Aspergillus wentii DTO 134E9]|uniref:Uncharacterized protein n=1 Tax=Aspergillus wentii DTO 134E9 TaxID=1073089 RepID=A0A1L9S1Y4_ASPWE|nr:uncharacterized protein ASPWEDRAFT_249851 [Aspergillus wentii DTO 134E9]OJJ41178.1 hypothetical protein ASPWEDRAFT_249851 [Aspergillus wentii DTO 134E9]